MRVFADLKILDNIRKEQNLVFMRVGENMHVVGVDPRIFHSDSTLHATVSGRIFRRFTAFTDLRYLTSLLSKKKEKEPDL